MIVAVDPGGHTTGIVVRERDRLIDSLLIERDGPLTGYLHTVVEAVDVFTAGADAVAVEDLNDPTPHMGTIALRGLLDTAQVIGALVLPFDPILVAPNRHGTSPLQTYPRRLVGAREVSGTGRMRHCRAAWDIAAAAQTMLRVGT